jgi:hypothetical protein
VATLVWQRSLKQFAIAVTRDEPNKFVEGGLELVGRRRLELVGRRLELVDSWRPGKASRASWRRRLKQGVLGRESKPALAVPYSNGLVRL